MAPLVPWHISFSKLFRMRVWGRMKAELWQHRIAVNIGAVPIRRPMSLFCMIGLEESLICVGQGGAQ